MQALAGNTAPADVVKTVWLRALPARTRGVLASLNQDNLGQLAMTADKILEMDSPASIMSVQSTLETNLLEGLIREIAEIKKSLAELTEQRGQQRGRSRNRSSGRRPRSSGPRNREGWLCHYHYRFADKAEKCEQPCAWEKKKEQEN